MTVRHSFYMCSASLLGVCVVCPGSAAKGVPGALPNQGPISSATELTRSARTLMWRAAVIGALGIVATYATIAVAASSSGTVRRDAEYLAVPSFALGAAGVGAFAAGWTDLSQVQSERKMKTRSDIQREMQYRLVSGTIEMVGGAVAVVGAVFMGRAAGRGARSLWGWGAIAVAFGGVGLTTAGIENVDESSVLTYSLAPVTSSTGALVGGAAVVRGTF